WALTVALRRTAASGARDDLTPRYFRIGLWVIVANVGLLVALSLHYSTEATWTESWTFVQEVRYYAPSMALVLGVVGVLASRSPARTAIGARVLLACAFAAGLAGGIARWREERFPRPFHRGDANVRAVLQRVQELQKADGHKTLVLSDRSDAP